MLRPPPVLEDTPRPSMHFRRLMFLKGPNIWSRNPVMEVWVDLGELKDLSSELIPGFTSRLMGLLPSLIEHRCSVGERGGFLQRLERGTYMAHVLEHVTLELETLAGNVVGFGRAREMSEEGVYKVAIRYQDENTAFECLHAARELILSCVENRPFDIAAELKRLRDVVDAKCLGPSTMSIVNAALERDIPFRRLNNGSLVQFGQGKKQRRIWTAETDRTGAIAESIAQDKQLTKSLLSTVGVPVPEGRLAKSPEDAWRAAQETGLPVVVKPRDANHARGVFPNLKIREDIMAAYQEALKEGTGVIVERFIPGCEHRVLVVGSKVVAAVRGDPVYVVGDGQQTVLQLVNEQVNSDPRRGPDEIQPLSEVELIGPNLVEIQQQGFEPDSVPCAGTKVLVSRSDNLSRDVTDEVHPSVAYHAVLAAKTVGLDVAGLDMVLEDISRPLEEQGGAIVEINAGPGLLMHLSPLVGKPRPVGEAIIRQMFADGDNARIPIVCITGSNGKTTVARLVRHLLQLTGQIVGLADSDGCYAGTWHLDHGPCDDAQHASGLILNPEVEAAVIEAGADGILRNGLACDKVDVAVVTNMADPDHLGGEFDLYEIEKVFSVKRTPVDVVLPTGAAVLNAADGQTLAMKGLSKGDCVLFARDGELPAIREHLTEGKRAVVVEAGEIVLREGEQRRVLMSLDRIPLTFGAKLAFQVENVIAAVAVAWWLKLDDALITRGLETFSPANDLPGRFQVSDIHGATVIRDQAKNFAAFEQVIQALDGIPHQTRRVIFSVDGDRRNEDIIRLGQQMAAAFDEVFIFDPEFRQKRPAGEVVALLQQALEEAKQNGGRVKQITVAKDRTHAEQLAIAELTPNHLVLLQQVSPRRQEFQP